MPSLEHLTQTDILTHIGDSSFKKGRSYVYRVSNPQRIGNRLKANVQGTRLYSVEAEVSANSIPSLCTCSWGGNCKHVAAVLINWIQSPRDFKVLQPDNSAVTVPAQRNSVEMVEVATQPTTPIKGLPAWMETSFAQQQQQQREAFEQLLQTLTIDEMRRIASNCNWAIKGTRKADLARQLLDFMLNAAENQRLIDSLDLEHRKVLAAVALIGQIRSPGFAMIERIADSFGKLQKHKKFGTYLEHLYELGLLFYSGRMPELGFGEQARLLPLQQALLPPLLGGLIPSSPTLPVSSEGADLRFGDGSALLHAFEEIILLLDATPTPLRKPLSRPVMERFYPRLQGWDFEPASLYHAERTGALKPPAQAALVLMTPPRSLPDLVIQQLSSLADDEVRLEFLYQLLLAMGVVQPGSPVTVRPQVRDELFRYDEASQRALLARTWFNLGEWSELWEVSRQNPSLKLKYSPPSYYATQTRELILNQLLVAYRKSVLSMLSLLPDNQWIALNDLFKFCRAWWKGFNYKFWDPAFYAYGLDQTGQTQGYWYLVNDDTPLNGDKMQDWSLAQGNFIRFILQGPLYWLGLVDLHLQDGTLTHFRLHNLADLFFNRVAAPPMPAIAPGSAAATRSSVPASGALTVKGDIIEVIPAKVNGRVHSLLERIAKREQALPTKFVYRLDVATAHQSFEAGLALSDLNNEWKQLLDRELPKSLANQLQKWWDAYGQVRLYQAMTIIEFSDEHTLQEMKALTSLNSVMLVELSPRLVVIPQNAVEKLMGELQKAGYTPKLVG